MDPWRKYPFLTSGQAYRIDHFLLKYPWAKPAAAAAIALVLILGAYLVGTGLSRPSFEPFSLEKSPSPSIIETKTIVKTVEVRVPTPGQGGIISYTGISGSLVGGWGDNIHWEGQGLQPVDGAITIKVDPEHNIGSVVADLRGVSINSEDRTRLKGDVRIEFASFRGTEGYMDGGVAKEVELFGNTGRDTDLLPRVTAHLAAWGTAEVLLDGQSVYSKIPAFVMVTDAMRREDGAIALEDGTRYEPKLASVGGFSDPRRQEITLLLRSDDVDKKNKPQNAVVIHLVFKEVSAVESAGSSPASAAPKVDPAVERPAPAKVNASPVKMTSGNPVAAEKTADPGDKTGPPDRQAAPPPPPADESSSDPTSLKRAKAKKALEEKLAAARAAETASG